MTNTLTIEIVKYPNEILRQKATPIAKNDSDALMKLQEARKYILVPENNAAGLAMPQFGESKRGFAAFLESKAEIVMNPKVLKKSGLDWDTEGCLSVDKKITDMIPRPTSITVQYFNHQWKLVTRVLKGWDARVFMHELDHLNGVMFMDHIERGD